MDEAKIERIAKNVWSFMRAVHIMKSRSEEAGMKPLPMDPQYMMLGLLRQGAIPMSELGRYMGRSKPNMTAIVDGLIDKELARRLHDKSDRRIVRIEMTEKGRTVMEERRKTARRAIRANLASLSESELEELCDSLESVNRIIAKANRDRGTLPGLTSRASLSGSQRPQVARKPATDKECGRRQSCSSQRTRCAGNSSSLPPARVRSLQVQSRPRTLGV
ncbi:MarR family transcriptional regulator [Candidatus Micrarchaeota archaeon]|nr:MarR family transcriptional regulator [Candidatus Micrarchaeota archaeon]